jgi:putative toxin-antitoxin system antitoxin component (TIGR02293 family)
MLVRAQDIANVLGGAATLGREVRDLGDLNMVVLEGMPIAAFERLSQRIPSRAGQRVTVRSVVGSRGVTGRTRLAPLAGERTERVARIFAMAEKVFGTEGLALEFLTLPHARLYDKSPLQVLGTDIGGREVEEILGAIAYGLPG